MKLARAVIAGTLLVVLAAGIGPAQAYRVDLLTGVTVTASGTGGATVEAYVRDILVVSEGSLGQPVPTLNRVTSLTVRTGGGALVCVAQPLAVFDSDPMGTSVHLVSNVPNCTADLTWTSTGAPALDPPYVTAGHVLLRLSRPATVTGSLRGSSYGGTGEASRPVSLAVQAP